MTEPQYIEIAQKCRHFYLPHTKTILKNFYVDSESSFDKEIVKKVYCTKCLEVKEVEDY